MDAVTLAVGKGGELLMFEYQKFLQYPIKIKNPNPRLANIIITQYGGAGGKRSTFLKKYTKDVRESIKCPQKPLFCAGKGRHFPKKEV